MLIKCSSILLRGQIFPPSGHIMRSELPSLVGYLRNYVKQLAAPDSQLAHRGKLYTSLPGPYSLQLSQSLFCLTK